MASFLNGLLSNLNSSSSSSVSSSSQPRLCVYCKIKEKYTDGDLVYPYCGLTCANLAKGKQPADRNPAAHTYSTVNPFSLDWTDSTDQSYPNPGHSFPAYVDPNGAAGKYRTQAHEQTGCISCRKAPTNGSVVFCQPCYDEVLSTAPMIVKVPEDHERYKSVASQFRKKWSHNKKCPEVREIYKIVSTTENLEKYQQYLDRVEARGNFISRRKSRGNENRRWHGTTRTCNIGDRGVTEFCSNSSCSLCRIMKTSFDRSLSVNTGMFGTGIYTTATSSKSDYFSTNGCISDRKAMLLNKVAVGRGYKMRIANTSMARPPAGYDSVIAEAGAGLNYDELVVYSNDAIRPSYLVMYDGPR